MSTDGIRLSRGPALLLHAVAAVLFASGAIAAIADVLDAAGGEPGWFFHAKPMALAVHGGAALAFLVVLGALLPTHVARAWRARRNRVSGSIFLAAIAALILTGYGLLYAGDEEVRFAVQWLHIGVGVVEPFLFLAHVLLGRRSR